ncbi:MAG: SURF1 family protein [Actinomycetota bacterium]|nr:SURF1 family protein [Actinomycetota bacterium]
MQADLFKPKWLAAHLLVAGLVALFVSLGFWQLGRLEERRALNAVIADRYNADPVSLEALEGEPPAAIEYRRVLVNGVYLPAEEVLIRSQVYLGTAGFHVVTPMGGTSASSVLVNRGWVPLGVEEAPGSVAPPSQETTEILGWVHLTQERPPLGPEEPPGDIDVMNRVDINRIQTQVPYPLLDIYVVEISENESGELPVTAAPPDFTDEGPHFAYAFQWFGFALIAAVGYPFLIREKNRRPQSDGNGLANSSTTS